MYAVIETGGKQYRVELGTELAVERLAVNPGDSVEFDRVLLVADGESAHVGTPTVSHATVAAHVVRQDRGEKIIVFKYRPKARRRVKKGHRQELTVVRVEDIRLDGRSAAQEAGTQAKEQAAAERAEQAEAEQKAAADKALADKLAAETTKAAKAEAKPPAKGKATTAKGKATTAKASAAAAPPTGTRRRTSKAAAPEGIDAQATAEAAAETKTAAKTSGRSRTSAAGRTAKAASAETTQGKTKTPRSTRGTKNTKKDS